MTIDLRSDTVTRPGPAMRRAMAEAEVGDDVLDGDPTVRLLERRIADMLGKEDALFFPTGSMANQSAIALLAPPGTEALVDPGAHVLDWELAAASAMSGVQLRPVRSAGPMMTAAELIGAMRPRSRYAVSISLICLENTHNGAGGQVYDGPASTAVYDVASEAGLPVHLDGARLWNAAVASGLPLSQLAAGARTVMVSFSKAVGAPVGAALACREEDRERLWAIRKRFGGGMRQSGILAAGALFGLENNLSRIEEDHRNARRLADLVDGVGGARVVAPQTNIVMIDLPDGVTSAGFVPELASRGVRVSPWTATRVRAVTHLDVTRDEVERAGDIMCRVLSA